MNEMFKASNVEMLELYRALFNKIITEEKYPKSWNTSHTQLIYKDGARDDPSNYRGISLTSNMSKLFNSILYTKLETYLEDNKIIRPEQGGFRKNYRTADHIFVLQTIIEKYITKGQKIYGCFVDLKKAYDSVWRKGLIHKINQIGLGGKIGNIISEMYKETHTSLIYKDRILPKIHTSKGVKQGDNLSPLLFNIYINDLPESIEKGDTRPVQLHNGSINSLMWADDLVVLSETDKGLQQCINNLYEFSQTWINIKKTKAMTFNKTGAKIKQTKIFLGETLVLDKVTQYSYLGFTICASGTFSHGTQKLLDKAKRAWFGILRILGKSSRKNIDTYTTLFDNTIKPIALYSCEIWGTKEKLETKIEKFGRSECEKFQTQICKNILAVNRKTSNIATVSELGRYPLYTDIHKKIVRYLIRFESLDKDRLLYKAYQEQRNEIRNKCNWLSRSKQIFDNNGFSYVFRAIMNAQAADLSRAFNTIANKIQKREKEIFKQQIMYHNRTERNKTGR